MRVAAALTFALSFVVAAALPSAAQAASATQPSYVEITLKDGSVIFGVIESDTGGMLKVRTVAGAEMTVARSQIVTIHPVAGQVVDSEFRPDDAVSSKLFLGPTGRALKRGEGYFAIDSFLLPVMQVGVTDRFSIGLGKPFWFFTTAAWVTPKFQVFDNGRTSVAAGALHVFGGDPGFDGVGYVATTHGSKDNAITFGVGGFYGEDGDTSERALLIIGGETRIGRRSKLVTENYIFDGGIIATVGTRIIGRTFSWEIGAIVPVAFDGDAMPGIFLNFVWHSRATPSTPRLSARR